MRGTGPFNDLSTKERPIMEEKRELTRIEAVEKVLVWQQSRRIGPGFANLGNTCYLNSVLQCLIYTPCFAQLLLKNEMGAFFAHGNTLSKGTQFGDSGGHSKHSNGFCSVRAISRLLQSVHSANTVRVLQPKEVVMNVRHISKSFRIGRQEDSHEFFRLLLDSMQRSCLRRAHIKSENHATATTTFVHRIFGGKLKSCLKCANCGFVSARDDDFLDLSLEIAPGVKSILGALRHFTATETLDDSNAWKCSHCGQRSRAEKGLSIVKCPNVLMIHLKRFDVMSGKIKRHVEFSPILDIATGMTKGCDDLHWQRTKYELHAVLVHAGFSTDCGHYFAFVKGSSGQWYEMNDDSVRWVGIDTVLQQKAYMLFYSRVLPLSERAKATEKVEERRTATATLEKANWKQHEVVAPTTAVRTGQGTSDRDGLVARLLTPVVDEMKSGQCTKGLVTFRVTKRAQESDNWVQTPRFGGRLGRVHRFHPASWTLCPHLAMNQNVAEGSKPSDATPVATRAPLRVPFDPQQLKNVGVRSAALFGREVDKWTGETDVESLETTSDEAVDKAVLAQHDRVLHALKQEEWQDRNARRQDAWDATLDGGKLKKVKKRKAFVPNQGRHNVFLKTLMHRKDVKRQRTEW